MKALHTKAKQDKLSLTASRALVTDNLGNVTASATTSAELSKLNGLTATTTELNYVDGVTSPIQTQLNAKAASSDLSNHISAYNTHNSDTTKHITSAERSTWNGKQDAISGAANSVMITDANGKPTVSSVITVAELNKLNGLTATTTELNHLDGAKSNIQGQIDNITGAIFPKYESWVPILTNNGDSYTTSKNGYLYVFAKANHKVYLQIGSLSGFTVDGCNTTGVSTMFPVAAGVKITRSNDSSSTTDTTQLAICMIYPT